MLILQILLLLGPALISVLLYERFKGYELTLTKRISLLFVFAFFINMVGYATLWVRGWGYHSWTLDSESGMTNVSFVLKYMGITLVAAVALAFILSLVRVSKRNDKTGND